MRTLLFAAALSIMLVSVPSSAGELSRREAARLAAQKAEEATNRTSATGAPAAKPAPAQKPPAPPPVDTKNVTIVSAKDVTLHTAGDLVGKRYVLTEIDGEKAPEDTDAFIEWQSGAAMSGRLCNLFRAKCAFEDTVLTAEEIPAKTKMACADETMGKVEERFFAALRLGMSFLAVGESLELRRDDLVLRFMLDKEETAEKKEEPEAEEVEESEKPAEKESGEAPEDSSAEEPLVSEVAVTEDALLDRKFVLSKVDGHAFVVSMGSQPFIEFGEGMRVGGSACNVFTGLGELADGKLRVRNAVATRKMCIDPTLSGFEKDFHKILREGAEIALDGDLLLLTGEGKTLEFVEEK